MSELRLRDRLRDWLGAKAFRLTCWLYRLPAARTYLETECE